MATEAVWARSPAPHTAVISREKDSKRQKHANETVWARSPAPHTAINSREKEGKIYKIADETVWARSPAPHTAVISKEKDSKRQKRADETVWARSPAPHTAVNSIGREERRREREQFCYSFIFRTIAIFMARFVFIATAFMQTLYSKIFTATIIIMIIITFLSPNITPMCRCSNRKREEKDRGERGERGESDLPEHMRA